MKQYPYQIIAEKLESRIFNNYYEYGKLLPSVRALAEAEKYNPATIQKALKILADDGLIISARTAGYLVAGPEKIEKVRRRKALTVVDKLVCNIKKLGYSADELNKLIFGLEVEIKKEYRREICK